MELSIKFDKAAENQLDQSLHYLLTSFGSAAAESFFAEFSTLVEQLLRYPESGRPSGNKDIRYVQLRKSHYVYYRFDADHLYVVGLIGTKQRTNPFR